MRLDEQRGSPLKRARLARGWTQAATMRRFQAVVRQHGGTCPDGGSLRRMFAYWESGDRVVTEPVYQRAFVELFEAAPAVLGFAEQPESRVAEVANRLRLFTIDDGLVALVEAQTDALRMMDRRVGTAVVLAQAEAQVDQVARLLHASVGGARERLAAALAEAAALAGWLALDDGSVARAWELHETARSAAHESGDQTVLAHVRAQQATVLLDADQAGRAVELANMARVGVRSAAPPLLESWLNATHAECLAAAGDAKAARAAMDVADHLAGADAERLNFLMLTPPHIARWRGHCLARLRDPAAIPTLRAAAAQTTESVRAAIGLKTDLSIALHHAGQVEEAVAVARDASDLAALHGSRRQQRRLDRYSGRSSASK